MSHELWGNVNVESVFAVICHKLYNSSDFQLLPSEPSALSTTWDSWGDQNFS